MPARFSRLPAQRDLAPPRHADSHACRRYLGAKRSIGLGVCTSAAVPWNYESNAPSLAMGLLGRVDPESCVMCSALLCVSVGATRVRWAPFHSAVAIAGSRCVALREGSEWVGYSRGEGAGVLLGSIARTVYGLVDTAVRSRRGLHACGAVFCEDRQDGPAEVRGLIACRVTNKAWRSFAGRVRTRDRPSEP